jgi:hypothetical protein
MVVPGWCWLSFSVHLLEGASALVLVDDDTASKFFFYSSCTRMSDSLESLELPRHCLACISFFGVECCL